MDDQVKLKIIPVSPVFAMVAIMVCAGCGKPGPSGRRGAADEIPVPSSRTRETERDVGPDETGRQPRSAARPPQEEAEPTPPISRRSQEIERGMKLDEIEGGRRYDLYHPTDPDKVQPTSPIQYERSP